MARVLPSTAYLWFYRPAQIVQIFGIDRSTVRRWRRNGTLPPMRTVSGISGWTLEEVEALPGLTTSSSPSHSRSRTRSSRAVSS